MGPRRVAQDLREDTQSRHDICHKHHNRRLCKIISTGVKFYFVNVFLEHGCVYHFFVVVIFSHVNQRQSVKWANKYKILILNSHFRLRKLRSSYQGTKNVAIYAFSSGKILDVRQIAGVKDMTNIMSAGKGHTSDLLVISEVFKGKADSGGGGKTQQLL